MSRAWVWLGRGLGVAANAILTASLAFGQTASTPSTHKAPSSKTTGNSSTANQSKSTVSKSASTKSKSSHPHTGSSHTSSRRGKHAKKVRGQQKIDGERTHQIQEALIRQHYLNGQPTGKWDSATEDALRRFQAD